VYQKPESLIGSFAHRGLSPQGADRIGLALVLHSPAQPDDGGSEGALQLDRLAMRGTPVGFSPGLFSGKQRSPVGQTFGRDQVFESRKPMIIVL
jgi:hypothetical protein